MVSRKSSSMHILFNFFKEASGLAMCLGWMAFASEQASGDTHANTRNL
jgi:hypothetical protein